MRVIDPRHSTTHDLRAVISSSCAPRAAGRVLGPARHWWEARGERAANGHSQRRGTARGAAQERATAAHRGDSEKQRQQDAATARRGDSERQRQRNSS